MKKFAVTLAAVGFMAGSASAGSLGAPIMEEDVVIETVSEGSASATGIVLVMGLLLIAAAVSD